MKEWNQLDLNVFKWNQLDLNDFIKKEILAQVFSCEFCEISKNSFSYRTPPVAASGSPYCVTLHLDVSFQQNL